MTRGQQPLPPNWEWTTLGKVGRWSSGGTPKSTVAQYYGGPHLWAGIGDLTDGYVDTTDRQITDAGLAESSAKLIPAGSLLVAMYGGRSIGKLGIARHEMATNQAIACCQPGDSISTKWLFYWLMNCRDELTRAGKGGTQDNISQTVLKAWPVPVPPQREQRIVVEVIERLLSLADAAADSAERAAERSKTLMAAFLNSAVDGTLLGMSPSAGLPWPVPDSWAWETVEDVAEVRGGIQKKPDRRPRRNTAPFLRVANVQRDALALDEIHEIELFEGELSRYRLELGDLLVVEGNGSLAHIGRSAIWDGSVPDCVHQNHLIRVRPGNTISPKWLNTVWNSPRGSAMVRRAAKTTSGLYTLSTRKVAAVRIPVPPREQQDALLEELDRKRGIAAHAERESMTAVERGPALRRAVLHAAFTGRLSGAGADAPSVDDIEEVVA